VEISGNAGLISDVNVCYPFDIINNFQYTRKCFFFSAGVFRLQTVKTGGPCGAAL